VDSDPDPIRQKYLQKREKFKIPWFGLKSWTSPWRDEGFGHQNLDPDLDLPKNLVITNKSGPGSGYNEFEIFGMEIGTT
jgi:hypothetical protein